MTLKEINGKIAYIDSKGIEGSIHVFHCIEEIKEIKEGVAKPFLVMEEATNFARVHLVTDFSKDYALQQVDEYLREKENLTETHLIGVFEVDFE